MTTAIDQITPITRMTDAAEVATGAYDDLIALLETLRGGEGRGPAACTGRGPGRSALLDACRCDEWRAPTECPAWNVSDMVGHLIGSAKAAASKRELFRPNLYGFRPARVHDANAMHPQ